MSQVVDCVVVSGLLGRWFDHDFDSDADLQLFEEHLLLCPPCLTESQRLRVALDALRAAGTPPRGRAEQRVSTEPWPEPAATASGAPVHWKFLAAGGVSPFATFDWRTTAGAWVTSPDARGCRAGVHACRAGDLPYWLNDELWEIELEDPVPAGRKVVATRARLLDQVTAWGPEVGLELAVACLRRTVEHAVQELRSAKLADEAEQLLEASAGLGSAKGRKALKVAAGACAGASSRLLRRQAARMSMYVVDAVDYFSCPVATLAYIAARAANQRTDVASNADPYRDERQWQADWLVNRLGLQAP